MQWIYDTLRSNYDIQQRGINFFNILDVKFDPDSTTPVSFYNKYRTVLVNNLAKAGDVIRYKNDGPLTEDEKMTPMLEDLILLNVLREIDPRLLAFVKLHYNHKMQHKDKLMDFKSDMLVNIPSFLNQINNDEHNNAIKASAALQAFQQQTGQKIKRKPFFKSNKKSYCRLCYLENQPRNVFTSHDFGD